MRNIDCRTRYERFMDYYFSKKAQGYMTSKERAKIESANAERKLEMLERKILRVNQEGLTKKAKRIIGRHLRLIAAIKEGVAYCNHPNHPGQITPQISCHKNCHMGDRGYCQHLKPNYNEWPHSKP